MQVNTTKHQTWHSKSPNNHKQNVNKSYYITTEVGDEYEDDMYEDTEDEYTEDKYTEDEYTEDEDLGCQEQAYKQEYNDSRQKGQGYLQWLANQLAYYKNIELSEDDYANSVFYRKRGPGYQQFVENQLAYYRKRGQGYQQFCKPVRISSTSGPRMSRAGI